MVDSVQYQTYDTKRMMKNAALIITDIQNDFLPGGALAVSNGDEIIPLVNRLQELFPLVVATQDWHPVGHKSFASAHPGKNVFDRILLEGADQILWPDHCVQGSAGAALASALSTDAVEAIFRKGMDIFIDSYSCFYDNEWKKSTGLADYLRGRHIQTVYLVGLAGDFCVGFSAMDALSEGFETFVIEDATRSISETGYIEMEKMIRSKGGKIIQSDEFF